ncbi:uncharacterized protein ARMOST_09384 [Armillaria ostoyae]|uniref:Uncharacterized protein n=1 Tax=Armillaria ostoyae TaxID=47428 RepID=A0A284RBB2_ARMOS|nr:uncharacterized protein ARMOST_09384 [Armillaria ostoyae]
MSFFSDENIDPRLRAINPVQAYIEETRQRYEAQVEQALQVTQVIRSGNPDEEQDTAPSPLMAISLPSSNLVASARRLKRKYEFSDEAEVDLDEFCVVPSEEHQLLLMAVALQNRDLLIKLQDNGSTWEISKKLLKSVWQYTKAFLLSSVSVCYVGDSAQHVMVALREMKVKDLPPEDDIAANSILQSKVSYCLTTKRAHFKEQIRISIQDNEAGKAIRNIAHLTKKVIGKSDYIPQTQQLYMRLSVARYVYASSPKARGDNYWDDVDQMLHGMQEHGDDLFVFCLNDIYEKDKQKYGDPVKTGIKSVEINVAKLAPWVRKVNELAPKVQIAEGDGQRSAKRRRTADNADEDSHSDEDEAAGAGINNQPSTHESDAPLE